MFDSWLREMTRAGKGGVRTLPATRGKVWAQAIILPGDWSAATFRGEVRSAPDAGGAALAAFTITSPSYDSGSGKTTINLSLASGTGANSTGSLTADSDGDGVEDFVFDILATPSGGDEEVLVAGVLPVTGRVTE